MKYILTGADYNSYRIGCKAYKDEESLRKYLPQLATTYNVEFDNSIEFIIDRVNKRGTFAFGSSKKGNSPEQKYRIYTLDFLKRDAK